MAHSICTQSGDESVTYFEQLWDILLAPNADLGTRLERLFEQETDEFGLEYGFLSRIDPEARLQHFQVFHGSHEQLRTDSAVPLQVTYCRTTIAQPEGTLAISDAVAEGWADDPAYEAFELGSYVGTTVYTDDDLYGTLCFASAAPRDEAFADEELMLLEMCGQWVTYELNQWSGPPTEDGASVDLGEHDISSSQVDRMMDVLGNEIRRVIVLSLLDNSTDSIADILEERADTDYIEAALYHVHLPKLKEAGYIKQGHDSETMFPGPNFSEIEPFLRQLAKYREA